MTDLKQHPLSAAFPKMTDDAFAELRADIAANGLLLSIIMFEDQILDGWHRFQACKAIGVAPKFRSFEGDETGARRLVVSANLKRRHLDSSQRAVVAGRFANMPSGARTDLQPRANLPQVSIAKAAADLNVSPRSVKDARAVLGSGDADLIEKVERGDVSVSRAAKQVRAKAPKPAPKPKAPPPPLRLVPPTEILPRTIEQWRKLSPQEQEAHLDHRNPQAKLNRQNDGEDDNAIDWAKWTWNPITGCLHDCPYCYARDIAERFAGNAAFPNGFTPTLRADRLSAPLNGLPHQSDDPREARIFTGSMSDIFGRWVPEEWINSVLGIAQEARNWEFLMLTKFPKRMAEFEIPTNVWMGTSVDCQARVAAAEAAFEHVQAKVRWLSVEPMLEPLKFTRLDRFHLIVIGGASRSNKTPRWIPPYEWLANLQRQANDAGCAIYMKSNLYLKESPLDGPRYRFTDKLPKVFDYLRGRAASRHADAAD